jgi:hypothetical protein
MQEPQINLNGWQTITDYAKERKVSTQYISKLIRQGKVESRTYPELNGIKLVKELTPAFES